MTLVGATRVSALLLNKSIYILDDILASNFDNLMWNQEEALKLKLYLQDMLPAGVADQKPMRIRMP